MITTNEIFAICTFRVNLTAYHKHSRQACYAEWAIHQIQQGLSSYSLEILLGLTAKDNVFEADALFRTALEELNIPFPDEEEIIINFGIEISRQVLSKKISTQNACDKLSSIAWEADHPDLYDWYDLFYNDFEVRYPPDEVQLKFDQTVLKLAKHFLDTHAK